MQMDGFLTLNVLKVNVVVFELQRLLAGLADDLVLHTHVLGIAEVAAVRCV